MTISRARKGERQVAVASSGVWHNRRGEAFRLVGWRSDAPSRTAVLVHHGLGEHIGRYDTVARHLTDRVGVWGFDARGHGDSHGRRGDADGLSQLAEDFDAMIPVLLARSGCERVVLLGHSMGAAAVAWYLATRRPHPAISGVLLSAPPVAVQRDAVVRIKLAAARVARRVSPGLTLPNGLAAEHISSVPDEVARYVADPLVHDRLSVRLGWSLAHDAPQLPERAHRVSLPVLLWHGADDRIALPEGSRRLAASLPDVTFHEHTGARHEVHHERPEVVRELFGQVRGFLDRLDA